MRLHIHALIAFGLIVSAVPAYAASTKDHDDCDSADVDRNIKGCTQIIDDSSETDGVRSIAYVGRALALHDKGDLDHAMSDLDEAIKLDPQNALAYNDRGILWREKQDPDRAIADFTQAIRLNPQPRSDMAGPGHVNIYTNRGLAWQAKGDLDSALSDYNQAIKLDGDDAETYFYRAQLEVSKQDFTDAAGDLDQVIQRDPDMLAARYLRGAVRYELYMFAADVVEQSDLDGAIADFTEVIRLDPKNIMAREARADAWDIDGKRDQAIADLIDAVKLDPSNTDAIAMLKQLKPDYVPPSDPLAKLNWSYPTPKP